MTHATDPSAAVVLALAIILIAARAGGELASRLRQPAVLGELIAGVVLGNLGLAGLHAFDYARADVFIDMFARLGVLILLFEVGLESTVSQMMAVGLSSFLVAIIGVIAPFALGWGVGAWLLPGHSPFVHAFLGATLSATSVGITARVLKDLGRSATREARIILGAAVIDDVLGLVILAAVAGAIVAADRGAAASWSGVGLILGKATLFLGASIALGAALSKRLFALAARLKTGGVLLALGLSFCFLMSWGAHAIGLAPIVGAFAAGLVLEDSHYREFVARGEHGLEALVHPLSSFLVPIFFVVMGMRVDLAAVFRADVLALGAALTLAAIAGKQLSSLGVVGRGIDRLVIGLGMIPRGEVGLIFANLGLTLTLRGERIVDDGTYAAVVLMVIATTMVTPPLLGWRLRER